MSKQGNADIYMAVMITAIIVAGVMLAIISVTVCVCLRQKQWMTGQKVNIYTNSIVVVDEGTEQYLWLPIVYIYYVMLMMLVSS